MKFGSMSRRALACALITLAAAPAEALAQDQKQIEWDVG